MSSTQNRSNTVTDKINDGGPAFPAWNDNPQDDARSFYESGLSLRDYFAAKAMASIESGFWSVDRIAEQIARHAKTKGRSMQEHIAVLAYEMADAMLAERSKRGE